MSYQDIHWACFTPLQRCSRCILQPQLTGQVKFGTCCLTLYQNVFHFWPTKGVSIYMSQHVFWLQYIIKTMHTGVYCVCVNVEGCNYLTLPRLVWSDITLYFKWGTAGLNLELSFSKTGCLSKTKELQSALLFYYIRDLNIGFIVFLRALAWSKTQQARPNIELGSLVVFYAISIFEDYLQPNSNYIYMCVCECVCV